MDKECMICLEDIYEDTYAILSCNHIYHYKCIQDWIKQKNTVTMLCPVCETHGEIINIIEVEANNLKNSVSNYYKMSLSDNIDNSVAREQVEGNIYREQVEGNIYREQVEGNIYREQDFNTNDNQDSINIVNRLDSTSRINNRRNIDRLDSTSRINNRRNNYRCCNIL